MRVAIKAAANTPAGPGPVESDPIELVWNLRAEVDSPAYEIVWNTRSEVSSAAYELIWNTRAEVNSAVYEVIWNLRAEVSSSPWDLVWNLRAGVDSTSYRLIWNLEGEAVEEEAPSQGGGAGRGSMPEGEPIPMPVDSIPFRLVWDLEAEEPPVPGWAKPRPEPVHRTVYTPPPEPWPAPPPIKVPRVASPLRRRPRTPVDEAQEEEELLMLLDA